MEWEAHYSKLEQLYLSAPIQKLYPDTKICIAKESSQITMAIQEDFFHGAGAMHGSVYFRMLDDAAYFAAASITKEFFLVTSAFHIQFYRPASQGHIKAIGNVIVASPQVIHAEAKLFDSKNRLIASGKGSFVKSKNRLEATAGYK